MFPGSYIPRVPYSPLFVWERGTPLHTKSGEYRTRATSDLVSKKRSGVPRSESAPHGKGFYTASPVGGALLTASPICYVLPAGQRSALSRCLCGWTLLRYIV